MSKVTAEQQALADLVASQVVAQLLPYLNPNNDPDNGPIDMTIEEGPLPHLGCIKRACAPGVWIFDPSIWDQLDEEQQANVLHNTGCGADGKIGTVDPQFASLRMVKSNSPSTRRPPDPGQFYGLVGLCEQMYKDSVLGYWRPYPQRLQGQYIGLRFDDPEAGMRELLKPR